MTLALKIHRGFHSGVSAPLGDGEYDIGSSDECDFILSDPGIQPHHLRLRVQGDGCSCVVYDGADVFVDGVEVGADETPIPAFAIVSLGPAAFRLGPMDSDWPALPETETPAPSEKTAVQTAKTEPQNNAQGRAKTLLARLERLPKFDRRHYLAGGAVLVLLFILVLWWVISAAAVNRLREASELLEARGFTIAAEGAEPSAGALSVSLDDDAIVVTGAVDFVRHIRQIQDTLREGGFNPKVDLVAREENMRMAEQWFRDQDIPMQVRMLGKTRAAVYGYAENGEAAAMVMDAINPLLTGFETVGSEIIAWPGYRRIIEEIMAKRGLTGIELSPQPYHVIAIGMLSNEDQLKAWRETETELSTRLRFEPRFEWRRPPSEYLRLVRQIFEDRRIPFAASLRDRNTIQIAGYARGRDITEYAERSVAPLVADWNGGKLATDFTYWDEAEPVLRRLLAENGFDDMQIVDIGDFSVTLLGDVTQGGREDAWQRVVSDFQTTLRHAPDIQWRRPPPPENAWLVDVAAALAQLGFQPVEAEEGLGSPSALNIAKGAGIIRIFGAVETAQERRTVLEYADKTAIPVQVDIVSREDALEQVRRLLADRRAMVSFERLAGNRLLLSGFVKDVESGHTFLNGLLPLLESFTGVEERFTTWAEIQDEFNALLARVGLRGAPVEALENGIQIEADSSAESDPLWEEGMRALAGRIGAPVPVVWVAPPPPAQARPVDVVQRLRAMGMDPVLMNADDESRPMALTVRPDGSRIVVAGVVETTAEKTRILELIDEGILHLTVDVSVREESIRQAERFLAEMDIAIKLRRVGSNRIILEGYTVDLAAGNILLQEMRKTLADFVSVEANFTYWTDIRQPLSELLPRHGLERLAVYPGEYEIHIVGELAPEEEEGWQELLATLQSGMDVSLPIHWSETLPVIRRDRLARRLGLDAGNASALMPEMDNANPALLPLDLTGAIDAAKAEEEERQIKEAAEAEQKAAMDWRMRVLEVVTVGNTRKVRVEGEERLLGEGEVFQGHLIIEIFSNGIMMMKDSNMVIYTVEAPEPPKTADSGK